MFDAVVAETRVAGDDDIVKLLAALARNIVVRLGIEIGFAAVDELIQAELLSCDAEKNTPSPWQGT